MSSKWIAVEPFSYLPTVCSSGSEWSMNRFGATLITVLLCLALPVGDVLSSERSEASLGRRIRRAHRQILEGGGTLGRMEWQKKVSAEPDSAISRLILAQFVEDPHQKIEILRKSVQLRPDLEEAAGQLALEYLALGRSEDAFRVLQALPEGSANPSVVVARARHLFVTKGPRAAAKQLYLAIKEKRGGMAAQVEYIFQAFYSNAWKLGQVRQQARKVLARGARTIPRFDARDLRLLSGWIAERNADYSEARLALPFMNDALKAGPKDVVTLMEVARQAWAYQPAGRGPRMALPHETVLKLLRTAQGLDGEEQTLRIWRGIMELGLLDGNPVEGESLLQETPGEPSIVAGPALCEASHMTLGLFAYSTQDVVQAAESIEMLGGYTAFDLGGFVADIMALTGRVPLALDALGEWRSLGLASQVDYEGMRARLEGFMKAGGAGEWLPHGLKGFWSTIDSNCTPSHPMFEDHLTKWFGKLKTADNEKRPATILRALHPALAGAGLQETFKSVAGRLGIDLEKKPEKSKEKRPPAQAHPASTSSGAAARGAEPPQPPTSGDGPSEHVLVRTAGAVSLLLGVLLAGGVLRRSKALDRSLTQRLIGLSAVLALGGAFLLVHERASLTTVSPAPPESDDGEERTDPNLTVSSSIAKGEPTPRSVMPAGLVKGLLARAGVPEDRVPAKGEMFRFFRSWDPFLAEMLEYRQDWAQLRARYRLPAQISKLDALDTKAAGRFWKMVEDLEESEHSWMEETRGQGNNLVEKILGMNKVEVASFLGNADTETESFLLQRLAWGRVQDQEAAAFFLSAMGSTKSLPLLRHRATEHVLCGMRGLLRRMEIVPQWTEFSMEFLGSGEERELGTYYWKRAHVNGCFVLKALSDLGDRDAIPIFVDALETTSPELYREASLGLIRLTGIIGPRWAYEWRRQLGIVLEAD